MATHICSNCKKVINGKGTGGKPIILDFCPKCERLLKDRLEQKHGKSIQEIFNGRMEEIELPPHKNRRIGER